LNLSAEIRFLIPELSAQHLIRNRTLYLPDLLFTLHHDEFIHFL
jgi:hypothetical protein